MARYGKKFLSTTKKTHRSGTDQEILNCVPVLDRIRPCQARYEKTSDSTPVPLKDLGSGEKTSLSTTKNVQECSIVVCTRTIEMTNFGNFIAISHYEARMFKWNSSLHTYDRNDKFWLYYRDIRL